MNQQVGYVIGQDGEDLYGIARNNRAYMRKRGLQGAWYGIDKQVWEEAKKRNGTIQDNLVKIDDNDSNTGDPIANKTKQTITSTEWGGKCPQGKTLFTFNRFFFILRFSSSSFINSMNHTKRLEKSFPIGCSCL